MNRTDFKLERQKRRFAKGQIALLAALFAASASTLSGCKKQAAASVASAAEAADPLSVNVAPALMASVKVGNPSVEDVRGVLQVSARVQTDASRIARVGSPVPDAFCGSMYSKARVFALVPRLPRCIARISPTRRCL